MVHNFLTFQLLFLVAAAGAEAVGGEDAQVRIDADGTSRKLAAEGWYFSDVDQNCTDACANRSLECTSASETKMTSITTKAMMEAAIAAAPNRPYCKSWSSAHIDQGVPWYLTHADGPFAGRCEYARASGTSRCEIPERERYWKGKIAQRLCWCSSKITALNTCWKEVVAMENPFQDGEQCATGHYTLSRTDTSSWELCAGKSASATATGVAAEVTAEVRTDICAGGEKSIEVGKTIGVQIPCKRGMTTVGCAKGKTIKVNGKIFVELTSTWTQRKDRCPTPVCPSDSAGTVDTVATSAVATFQIRLAVVITVLFSMLSICVVELGASCS